MNASESDPSVSKLPAAPPLQFTRGPISESDPIPLQTETAADVGATHRGGNPSVRIIPTDAEQVAIYDFGTRLPSSPRILVLKLDHLGDFIIGIPSLQQIREAFPTATIRIVVGSWNRAAAEASGLVNEVVTYNYFTPFGWVGKPSEPLEKFRSLTAGQYDIAIDLRVDDDTRALLLEVNAKTRCGIGHRSRFPFLDIALPPEHRLSPDVSEFDKFIELARFQSSMPFKRAFYHETDFRPIPGHVIHGPSVTLPLGQIKVLYDLQLTGWTLGLGKTQVTLDIARDGAEIGVHKRLHAKDLRALDGNGVELSFVNEDLEARYEFRIHVAGKPLHTGLRFAGVRLEHARTVAPARFRRAELHIGEQLSLLVQLVAGRARILYRACPPSSDRSLEDSTVRTQTKQIIIAPYSNKELRDWPSEYYVTLIRLLTDRLNCVVTLIGSPQQTALLEAMAKQAGNPQKIRNMGGRTAWSNIPGLLQQADLVICNNSGIAHLAAAADVTTLAIYSASHQPQEWGPRGQRSRAVMAVVPCSPCGHDTLAECQHAHRCMSGLKPEIVFGEAAELLSSGVVMVPRSIPIGREL